MPAQICHGVTILYIPTYTALKNKDIYAYHYDFSLSGGINPLILNFNIT